MLKFENLSFLIYKLKFFTIMRKKYLSALLFGALLFASAGTFTSCKDYDDDINNLQSQITANAQGIEELKNLIGTGDYVTNIEKSAEGLVVTFKNAGSQTITLEDEVGSVVTVNEDGELCIDGEPTGIKVAETTPGETAKAPVKIEDGFWAVLNEDGEYDKTNIPVSGVSLAGDEQTGYTLTIVNADGSTSSVELPSAASSLVDLMLPEVSYSVNLADGGLVSNGTIALAQYTFNLNGVSTNKTDWKGSKELPANNSIIVAQAAPVMIQINPVNVDAKDVNFSLVNSQNKTADVTLEVKDFTGLLTTDKTRAANANGLYDLTIADQIFANSTAADEYTGALTEDNQALAVAAGKVRSAYKVSYAEAEPAKLTTYSLMDGTTAVVKDETIGNTTSSTASGIELNKWYTVTTDNAEALYDMYLKAADDDDAVLFGVEFQVVDGAYQVRATKTPDNVTKPSFDINVETIDKTGTWKESTITFVLSEVISDAYVYDLTEYQLKDVAAAKDNSFSVTVADMTSKFNAEQLALWNKKLSTLTYSIVDKDGKTVSADDLSLVLVDKDGKDVTTAATEYTAANVKAAQTMSVRFDNTEALAEALSLNSTYNIVVECKDENKNVISTAKIPFTLSIPAIETFFVQQSGVFVNGVANAYLDCEANNDTFGGDAANMEAAYQLKSAFNKFGENLTNTTFTIGMDSETEIVNKKKSSALAEINTTSVNNTNIKDLTVTLIGNTDEDTGLQEGYKQELIVNVTDAKFAGVWAYGKAGEVNYSFKIKVMSPLYEGQIVAADGTVEIPATDINGHEVTGDDIKGYTYNDIAYSIFKDQSTPRPWSRKEIKSVIFATTDSNIFTCDEYSSDYTPAQGETPAKNGTVTVYPKNLAETTDSKIKVTLTDVWGYKKVVEIPVKVVVNK